MGNMMMGGGGGGGGGIESLWPTGGDSETETDNKITLNNYSQLKDWNEDLKKIVV